MKKPIIIICLFFAFFACQGENSKHDNSICEISIEIGLNDAGYSGCWGDCQYQNINCFIIGIYKDPECTELIKIVRFDQPDTDPGILLSETMEWPDVVFGIFYVTDCNHLNWQIPNFWDYCKCGGPFEINIYKHQCGDILTIWYSDFDDSCIWGYQ